jgi:hypothetical protein
MRAGENVTLQVTGGGTAQATQYDLVLVNGITGDRKWLGQVSFPASPTFSTQTVKFPVTEEGVFAIRAEVGEDLLRPADLRAGKIAVIDTKPTTLPTETKRTLIHDIDCVKQTDNGQPIVAGQGFFECTEPTRVATSEAGRYREGGDGTDPNLPYPAGGSAYRKYNSGFAYAVDVPEAQQPYLMEVTYPDDDRRTVNVFVAEKVGDNEFPSQLYTGYETGDWYELSNKMQTEQLVFWARSTTVRAAILSKNPGMRAAAAHIKVYKLDEGLPAGPTPRADGRLMASWMEEPTRWLQHGWPSTDLGPMERDFVGIQRYVQLCRFHGFNAVMPTEAIYQSPTYYSDVLEGWFVQPYDAVRIVALMAEKYGIKYIPELHISDQAWFRSRVVEKLVPNPDELYLYSRLGTRGGTSVDTPTWDPLHPAIQEEYLKILGELADKLSDSPAFAGISSRLMSWVWQSWNGLPSLNWGYSDWDMATFTRETGSKVPGDPADPNRYEKRFEFLTSDANREKWIAWRNGKMLDYYKRMRDVLRKKQPNADLFLTYFGNARGAMDLIFGSYFGTRDGAMREIGLDMNALAHEPGIAVMPMGGFGRRDLGNLVSDAGISDSIADPAVKAEGFGYERAMGFGNSYFEDQSLVPIYQMGLGYSQAKPLGNNGAADGPGRYVLEKLALALADQDTGVLMEGGMGYTFGRTPEYWEFLSEYEQLPKLPFTALPAATDPVAVWYRDCPDGFYFYAVNREPYATTIDLTLSGVKTLTALGNGRNVVTTGGKLSLPLLPFQLRAFKADKGAQITGAQTTVPADRIKLVQDRLAFCADLAKQVTTGARKNDLSDAERKAFDGQVDLATAAAKAGHWWRARTVLYSVPTITVFQKLALWPEGEVHRRMGLGLLHTEQTDSNHPLAATMLTADVLADALVAGNDATTVDAGTYEDSWLFTKVLKTEKGALDFDLAVPVTGRYQLSLGHVAPEAGSLTVTLAGQTLPVPAQTKAPNEPQKTVFPVVSLKAGTARLSIKSAGGFGVYGLTLQPIYHVLPSPNWTTIGPFPTEWAAQKPGSLVRDAMLRVDPPMTEIDFTKTYPGADGKTVGWQYDPQIRDSSEGRPDPETGTSFLWRAHVQESQVCYAVTFLTSPQERDAQVLVGCDWWANAYLNGQKLKSVRPEDQVADDGSAFNGWRPLLATCHLKKGVNVLLVKSHGGSVANWFTCYVSDPGDLQVAPK